MKYTFVVELDVTNIKPKTKIKRELKDLIKTGITISDYCEGWEEEDPLCIEKVSVKSVT